MANRPGSRRRLFRGLLGAWFGLALAGLRASAQGENVEERFRRMVRDASRALQAGNAPLFLSAFDPGIEGGLPALREQVAALTAQRRIASSVEVGRPEGGPDEWTVEVDWLLELAPRRDPGALERRRSTLTIRFRKGGRKWRISGFEPVDFFSAVPRPGQ